MRRYQGGLRMFLASCIPGCGQMYQGYMKRGVSLLTAVCLVVALAGFLNIGELAIFLPVLWLYAFFDSYNIRNLTESQGDAGPDRYLLGIFDHDKEKLSALCRGRHSLIGWSLIAVGVYALYSTLLHSFGWAIPDWLYGFVYRGLPRMVLIAVMIGLGIWFIRGPREKRNPDFQAFVPPEAPEAESRTRQPETTAREEQPEPAAEAEECQPVAPEVLKAAAEAEPEEDIQ